MATNQPKAIAPIPQKDIDRFWSHVERRGEDECWPWTKGKTEDGYGRFKYLRAEHKANRIAYFLSAGDDPGTEFRVLHSCDFSTCCNPKHLRKGTTEENIQDRDERGRTARGDRSGPRLHPERLTRGDAHYTRKNPGCKQGELHGRAVLTEADVFAIRARVAAGDTKYTTIGREYGISGTAIKCAATGKAWGHLPFLAPVSAEASKL